MRPIFDRLCPCLRKGSSHKRSPSNTPPKAGSSSGRGSKGCVRLDAAETGFDGLDEESGYTLEEVGNQDKAQGFPQTKADDGIVITTEQKVERQ